jgi:hypothetical protein
LFLKTEVDLETGHARVQEAGGRAAGRQAAGQQAGVRREGR